MKNWTPYLLYVFSVYIESTSLNNSKNILQLRKKINKNSDHKNE